MPTVIAGLDLTDTYAKRPRPVDIALLVRETGAITFAQCAYPATGPGWADELVRRVRAIVGVDSVLVVDGPQALAAPEAKLRQIERALSAPGHTGWQMPKPRSRPFAGYVRTSVECFNTLVAAGYRLADLHAADGMPANLFEAYPGAARRRLHDSANGRLEPKSVRRGRDQRAAILVALGCTLPLDNSTHDQLDAAICAVLGWKYLHGGDDFVVDLLGTPVSRDAAGVLREGRMLVPRAAALAVAAVPMRSPQPAKALPAKVAAAAIELSIDCDWIYLAGDGPASAAQTYELAEQFGVIVRTAYKGAKHFPRISNVQYVMPHQTMLLAYRIAAGQYRPLAVVRIGQPDEPLDDVPAIGEVTDESLLTFLAESAKYAVDPQLKKYTGFSVELLQDLQEADWTFKAPGRPTVQPCRKSI